MINLRQELQDYKIIDVKSLTDSISGIPDNIQNSIVLYNKALDNLRSDSEDIAIIELKKAVSLNPEFHEAMNLLGLCYLYTREYTKAKDLFEKTAAAEKNGILALRYLNSMNMGDSLPNGADVKRKPEVAKKKAEPAGKQPVAGAGAKGKPPVKAELLKMAVGFVAGALLVLLVNLAFRYTPGELKASNNIDDSIKPPTTAQVDTSQYTAEIERLEEELEQSRAELKSIRNAALINEVETLAAARNYMAAADKLQQLKLLEFKEPETGRVDQLFKEIMPKAAASAYSEGSRLFNAKKYQEAVDVLARIESYESGLPNMDKALYLLGKSYAGIKDNAHAIEAFQKVSKDYPNSQYAKWAEFQITKLAEKE